MNADAGSFCTIGGAKYELLQFHFHHPSEHLLAGKPFDLECHFVHKSSAGNLAVVGVFVTPGARNAALQSIFDAMPKTEGPEQRVAGSIETGPRGLVQFAPFIAASSASPSVAPFVCSSA